VAALCLGVLHFLLFAPSALAFSDISPWPGPVPSPSIQSWTDGGYLTEIDYYVSSSAPSNSVRYKTLDYYITLWNNGNPTSTYHFRPTVSPPPSGTITDKFIVTATDLEGAGFTQNDLSVSNFSNISLSATIEIYNASTGVIYTTFGNADSTPHDIYPIIDQVGATYGFGQQDIVDMKTRFTYLNNSPPLPGGGSTCSLSPTSIAIPTQEEQSGTWSYDYWSWVEYCHDKECYSICQITSTQTGPYMEKMWMTVSPPDPATVEAGQGTAVTVTTYYENNDPAAWNGSSYSTGIKSMMMSGPLTDDWQAYQMDPTLKSVNMVLKNTQVYYNDYDPQTYSTGCNGGWFNVGYNVPVVEQTWVIPYARFDDNGWTLHQNPPTDINNQTVFGGLNRWYFGFDIPDGNTFCLDFMAQGGTTGTMSVCDHDFVTIKGTPYNDFVVSCIDPANPFPVAEPPAWKGFESFITET